LTRLGGSRWSLREGVARATHRSQGREGGKDGGVAHGEDEGSTGGPVQTVSDGVGVVL